MIALSTNRTEYRNDIAEEIRLFLGLAEIVLLEEIDPASAEMIFDLQLVQNNRNFTAFARVKDLEEIETFTLSENASPLEKKKLEKRALKLACYHLLKRLYPEIATPWGSLTGIRPTKLFRELSQEDGEESARKQFIGLFDVSEEKTNLAAHICAVQEPFIRSVQPNEIDVYVGIPFCKTKCLYCSFPSEVLGKQDRLTQYLSLLKSDIAAGAKLVRERGFSIRSFYMGGGTPTVLSANQMDELLSFLIEHTEASALRQTLRRAGRIPSDREKLFVLKQHGINRISINPQTMNDETLRRVGRSHTAEDIVRVYELARRSDLILSTWISSQGCLARQMKTCRKAATRSCDLRRTISPCIRSRSSVLPRSKKNWTITRLLHLPRRRR
jgi:oxygen-independent coproporphyrinogen-3 oxidase